MPLKSVFFNFIDVCLFISITSREVGLSETVSYSLHSAGMELTVQVPF